MRRPTNRFTWSLRATAFALVGLILSTVLITANTELASADPYLTATFTPTGAGTGSPFVFGGNINSDLESDPLNMQYTNRLAPAGITQVRDPVYLNDIVPSTTIANYQNNVNNVKDPSTWNWSAYNWVNTQYASGLKVMLIIAFDTSWLSYSGDSVGVPRNWSVYQDIVTKVYQHFTGSVNWVEVWNEPENASFLNISGSPYADSISAYKDIYYYTASAIRSVDATIPIGGPVSRSADTTWAHALLTDSRTSPYVNFLSYHEYEASITPIDSVREWKTEAAADGHPGLPIFVTEWNWDLGNSPISSSDPSAISYTGARLTNMFMQGAAGADIFTVGIEGQYPGFYWFHSDGSLVPAVSTTRLLSIDLGLGSGTSIIQNISGSGSATNAGAATNAAGNQVAWIVNSSSTGLNQTVTFNGLANGVVTAKVFEASSTSDATSARSSTAVTVTGGSVSIPITVPANSVVGILLPTAIGSASNGSAIYHWAGGTNWTSVSGGAVRVAVGPDGNPWVVNNYGDVFKRNGSGWTQIRGGDTHDVAVGADGTVAVSLTSSNGSQILVSHDGGTSWTYTYGKGSAVAVDPSGAVWAVASSSPGDLDKYANGVWSKIRSADTQDVAVGGNGTIAVALDDAHGQGVYVSSNGGSTWSDTHGAGPHVSVDSLGNIWAIAQSSRGDVDKYSGGAWTVYRHSGGQDVGASPNDANNIWITSN